MALWTPSQITTALWLDFSDASTLTLDSALIDQADDKSGNERHATSTSSARPTLAEEAINGLDVARFGGSQNMSAGQPFTGTGSVWYVQKTTDTQYIILSYGANSTTVGPTAQSGNTTAPQLNFGSPTYYRDGNAQTWSTRGDVYTALHDRVAVVGAVGGSMATWSTPVLFCGYVNFQFTGDLGEIIAIDGSVDTETRQLIEGYLAWKWGVEDQLPSGHPHEDAAPSSDVYGIKGVTLDVNGDPVSRTVRIYLESTGALVTTLTSSAVDGSWSWETTSSAAYTIVASGEPDQNALVFSGITKAVIAS
jgi:hypothetical protein